MLSARRRPYHNIQDFTQLGLDPQSVRLLVVKSGYLSPELAPIASPNLMALTDGAINQDIEALPISGAAVRVFRLIAISPMSCAQAFEALAVMMDRPEKRALSQNLDEG